MPARHGRARAAAHCKTHPTGPIYPATHHASNPATSDPNVPAMGQRLRLKGSYVIPDSWTIQEKAVLRALKKYGAIVADNGNFFSVSFAPDDRFPSTAFSHIRNSMDISNFEVIQTTSATGGPRSPGAPVANAGADQTILTDPAGASANLSGSVTASGAVTIQWKLYAGPAPVTFGNPSAAATTAAFSTPGTYTFMLSAADAFHAVAFDAAVITVVVTITPAVATAGSDIRLTFPTTAGRHYQVQKSSDLTSWLPLAENLAGTGSPVTVTDPAALTSPAGRQFYRVLPLD